MANISAIFSTLGNPNSLVSLAVKDSFSTMGMTCGSYVTGKEEGLDRLIDETGTEVIWLGAIPGYKWIYDKTVIKSFGLDPVFNDVRALKDKKVFEKMKQYAPTDEIKKNLIKIEKKQGLCKNLALYRFFFATGAAIASYIGLTKVKHAYTANKIKQNLINEHNAKKKKEKNENSNNLSFKGLGDAVKDFAFSPVKNMWLLEGAITGERLIDSRSPQELAGYTIREGLYLFFMYYVGNKIQKELEKRADKKFKKSIGLDSRVIEGGKLQKSFDDGSIQKSLDEFKEVKSKSNAEIYEFLHKNPENAIVDIAKKSDLIKMYKKPKKWYEIFKKGEYTDKIDTRKYIDLEDIKDTYKKVEKLYTQYKDSMKKETSEEFFRGVKRLKRNSITTNIIASILALGIITPLAMLLKRLSKPDNKEFHTKTEIRKQLVAEGIIS